MTQHTEKSFEDLIEQHLVTHGGWQKGEAAHFVPGLGFDPHELWLFVEATQPALVKELGKLFPGEKLKKKLVDDLDAALRTVGTLEVLRRGFKVHGKAVACAYFRPAHGMNPQLLEKYGKNRLTVTRQAWVNPSDDSKERLDLLLLLNGLPFATVELKNPMTGSSVEDAIEQYRSRDPNLPIYRFKSGALVHFAVSTDLVYMTTRLDGKQTTFLPFNLGHGGGAGNPPRADAHDTAYLWEEVWQRDSLLDLVARFLHRAKEARGGPGKKKEEKESIIFPRYHQLDVVRRLEAAAHEEGPGHNYLVQHSAGSGKSNSIAWLAHRLASLHRGDERVFHSVVVITDRKVLDRQLQDTIFQLDHRQGVVQKIDQNSEQLAAALQGGTPIIITTLQKFPVVAGKVNELPDRSYAVIIDEAHSSQGGESSTKMKKLLASKGKGDLDEEQEDSDVEEAPDAQDELDAVMRARGPQKNISFFAFTATPKARTLEVFGRPGEDGKPRPFHVYSMRQAIEEHFILDVLRNYTTYQVLYRLTKKDDGDPTVDRNQATQQLGYLVSLDEHNLAAKTRVMLDHFQGKVRHRLGGQARAMVVTSSRRHAVRYYLAFKKAIAEKHCDFDVLVAFSGGVTDPRDPPNKEYTEQGLNGFSEAELPSRFGQDPNRILIVANKYQTGFDQPLLQTMYIDRPIGGVQAVQTLSRLNRTYPGKTETFVLDFYNKAEDVQAAFQPYYEQTIVSSTADPQQLYKLQHELDAAQIYHLNEVEAFARVFYAPKARQTAKDHEKLQANLKPSLERFDARPTDEQDAFRGKLGAYVELYAFLSQILTFQDADLEKRYSFGRFLAEQLPAKDRKAILQLDGAAQLRYYRLDKTHEGSLTLQVAEPKPLPGVAFHEASPPEPKLSPLSEIINALNERFGAGLTEADQLFLGQVAHDAANDEEVVEAATVNDYDGYSLLLKKKLNTMMASRMDRNELLVTKYFDEADFQALAFSKLAQMILDLVRTKAAAPPSKPALPRVAGATELPVDELAEVGKLRNTLEPLLRKFIKRQLKAHLGAKWAKPLFEALPEQQREQLVGVDADKVLAEHLFLANLVALLHKGWDRYFKVLESGPPAQSVKKASVEVLLDFVNVHREDAHAKDISKATVAAHHLAVTALVEALERHLQD